MEFLSSVSYFSDEVAVFRSLFFLALLHPIISVNVICLKKKVWLLKNRPSNSFISQKTKCTPFTPLQIATFDDKKHSLASFHLFLFMFFKRQVFSMNVLATIFS